VEEEGGGNEENKREDYKDKKKQKKNKKGDSGNKGYQVWKRRGMEKSDKRTCDNYE